MKYIVLATGNTYGAASLAMKGPQLQGWDVIIMSALLKPPGERRISNAHFHPVALRCCAGY